MFKSAHQALSFAYRTINTPIVKLSSINSMRGQSGNSDLSPQDRHAQAAMIISLVERSVDVPGNAYLKAHYGRELQGGADEGAVTEALVMAAMRAMPTGVHSRRGVEKLVRIYFGKDISMTSVRTDFKCRHDTAKEHREVVHGALDTIGRRADDAAHRALDSAGLILVEVAA